jgi:hypothetical protein
MNLIKCRCKKTEMSFQNLKASDLPHGYTAECCEKSLSKEAAEFLGLSPSELKEMEVPVKVQEEPKKSKKGRKKRVKSEGNSGI